METNNQNNKGSSGFTLVELMIAIVVLAFVTAGLTSFMTSATRSIFWSTQKSRITNDVRLFTMRITQETIDANFAYVYKSIASSDRDSQSDRRDSGQSGDCLVLVYKEPYPDIDSPNHYTRIITYYREPGSDGVGPVLRSEVEFATPQPISTTAGDKNFENFLASTLNSGDRDAKTVLELSKGLADGRLFRVSINQTFVINGEIIHGNKIKEMTNTYNLTISTRG